MTYTLPPPLGEMPVVAIDAQGLDERHWRRMSLGERVTTTCQAYILMPGPGGGWQLSSFFTSDGQVVTGRTTYRAPASISAWLSVIGPCARKWWTRWTTKTPS